MHANWIILCKRRNILNRFKMHITLSTNTQLTKTLGGLFLICMISPVFLFAKHIIGGEMTYRYLQDNPNGTKKYEFTLVIYRDCDSGGGLLDNPASIGIYRGSSTNATLYVSFDVTLQGPVSVSPVIPPCADASAVNNACTQRGVYVFTRDLPLTSTESYFIVYQRCCRTDQITNVINPGSTGATYMVELTPQAQAANNSSPVYLNYPPTFICNNFKLNFDHSATDADGDSLAYFFCNPFDGGGQGGGPGGGGCNSPQPSPPCGPPFDLIPFSGVYSSIHPMGGVPLIGIDTFSGLLHGTPNILGQFVVGVCVKEYRNGVYLGMVIRDFQFNVVDCTPTVVANIAANAVTAPKKFVVKRCGDKIVSILNQTQQTPDLVSWEWEVDLKNGSIFKSNAWHLTVALPDFGQYTARLYLNRAPNLYCKDTAFVDIYAYPGVKANFSYNWDVCTEGPVLFSDSSISGASGGIVDRKWIMGTTGDTLQQLNPLYQFPEYGTYAVKLTLTDADGCQDERLQQVDWTPHLPPQIPTLAPQFACIPDSLAFTILDSLDLKNDSIVWNLGDGNFSYKQRPVHAYQKEGIYTVSIAITTQYDCFASDTFKNIVTTRFRPHANFSYAPQQLSNLQNQVQFTNLSDSSAIDFSWLLGAKGRSSLINPSYTFDNDTGLVPVRLLVHNKDGCADSLVQFLDLVPKLRLYLPNVFAPESDNGKGNDRFGVLGIIPGYKDFNLKIWSRWGELVFESQNPDDSWTGRRSATGKLCPTGVYVYQLNIVGPRGEPIVLQGTVTLLY